jgi:putative hydroxymethylpyrimidine transport system permease protein
MLQANGRVQTDLMFAAMIVLMIMGLTLYLIVDRALTRLTPWAPNTLTSTTGNVTGG